MTTKAAPQSKATGKAKTSAPGVKTLITAAALAATIGGWALFSSSTDLQTTTQSTQVEAGNGAAATLEFAPIPTVVPLPNQQAGTTDSAATTAPQPAQSLRPVTIPQMPALRAPITSTRSSR